MSSGVSRLLSGLGWEVRGMDEKKYQDAVELIDYAADHVKHLRELLAPAMTGEDLDIGTALVSYATRQLSQVADLLFESDSIG